MTKGRDTKQKEGKKKPEKSLKEKRADKAAKRGGTFKSQGTMKTVMDNKH